MEFDPIFASQDPAAMEIAISSVEGNVIIVQFRYPSNIAKISLNYQLERIDNQWRISDIVYLGEPSVSLKEILSR